jgi:hypothetical protein
MTRRTRPAANPPGRRTEDSTRPDGHHDPSSFDLACMVTRHGVLGHSRGTEHRVQAVPNGHQRSIKPQVNGQMARSTILDVEEIRPWLPCSISTKCGGHAQTGPRLAVVVCLVRTGSASHREPLVVGGHQRSRSAAENRRSRAVTPPTSTGEAAWDWVRAPHPTAAGLRSLSTRQVVIEDRPHPSRIRHKIECALIIPMIIQSILLGPPGAVWTDAALNVSRLDPSGAVQIDAEHPSRNRKVERWSHS